jgi:hypothetical protein
MQNANAIKKPIATSFIHIHPLTRSGCYKRKKKGVYVLLLWIAFTMLRAVITDRTKHFFNIIAVFETSFACHIDTQLHRKKDGS